jgi:hypothetical protein
MVARALKRSVGIVVMVIACWGTGHEGKGMNGVGWEGSGEKRSGCWSVVL